MEEVKLVNPKLNCKSPPPNKNHIFGPSFRNFKPHNVLTHALGFRKISAKLPILHALRHVCGIGGHTRTEKCLWRFSLQMHCNDGVTRLYQVKDYVFFLRGSISSNESHSVHNVNESPFLF